MKKESLQIDRKPEFGYISTVDDYTHFGGHMMKRFFSFAALALCLTMLFCSCGLEGSVSYINKKALDDDVVADEYTATEATALAGYTLVKTSDTLGYFTQKDDHGNTTHLVYNVETGKTVVSKTAFADDSETVSVSLDASGFAVVSVYDEDGCVEKTVYAPSGTKVCSKAENVQFVNDCIYVDYKTVYRYDTTTKEVINTYERSALRGDIPTCESFTTTADTTVYHSKYYYKIDDSSIVIYDDEYEPLSSYQIPYWGLNGDFYVFSDGTVLAQYLEKLPDDAKKYELIEDGTKYDVHHVRINPKNGKTKELDLDYLIQSEIVWNLKSDDAAYKSSLKNIAAVAEIKDGQIDSNYAKMYSLTSSGKLKTCLSEYDGQRAVPLFFDGYVLFYLLDTDDMLLLNSKLKEAGYVTGATDITAKYILAENDGIYDLSLNRLVDLTSDKYATYEYKGTLGNLFIYRDEETDGDYVYYLFNGSFKQIATSDTWAETEGNLYATHNSSSGIYRYYDGAGTQVFISYDVAEMVMECDTAALYQTTDSNGDVTYYRVVPQE
jgi:hypothetical protein